MCRQRTENFHHPLRELTFPKFMTGFTIPKLRCSKDLQATQKKKKEGKQKRKKQDSEMEYQKNGFLKQEDKFYEMTKGLTYLNFH